MARVRKSTNSGNESTNKKKPRQPPANQVQTLDSKGNVYRLTQIVGCVCLSIASYFGYLGYLETRVNTPFDNQKIVQRSELKDLEKYWGTYRPGNYFGLKTRDPYSLVSGLMWYSPQKLGPGGEGIRHWCELNDRLPKYGWTHHDGKTFGIQEVFDPPFLLETSFVKFLGNEFGGDWTARITVKSLNPNSKENIALLWYAALDEKTEGSIWSSKDEISIPGISGETSSLGKFKISFHVANGSILHESFLCTVTSGLQYLRETIIAYLRVIKTVYGIKFISLPGEVLTSHSGEKFKPNFVATQIVVETPFTLDISYKSVNSLLVKNNEPNYQIGNYYTDLLKVRQEQFNNKFENIFGLMKKGYGSEEVQFAKAALSNLIGGIGFFHGSSKVQSIYTKKPVPYWQSSLYTAVPSRSFFPRGFLWDEGFHGLLIAEWDLDMELDIISHWFDLMNVEGWIPREVILGSEALAKVPEEFVTQHNTNANPPTFFLTLKKIISKYQSQLATKGQMSTLEKLYPRIQAWFSWYNTTQKGELPGTYRWRGRDANNIKELNPKTLTSGLDDYPRASHPSNDERHVDLRCWIAFASGVMSDLATVLKSDNSKYWETYSYLSDNDILNKLHLSPYTETYSDWGLHTDSTILKRLKIVQEQSKQFEQIEMIRTVLKQPEHRFVDSTFGYVSLFPFFLEILEPDTPFLGKVLKDIRDPRLLWSNYGIRSLSKTSPLYMKRNTEHDPPYWRGQIWINLNYLALKALYHYGMQPGPYCEDAKRIYVELRQNLVSNILKEYKRTGYIWEQYNDRTGEGSGCHPFTGWSALIVLIMSEQY